MKRVIGITITAAIIMLAAILLAPRLLGYQTYVVTGGSMTGTIDRGSLVIDEVVRSSEIKRGDIITFTPPGRSSFTTHRVIAVKGRWPAAVFRTRGDANQFADPWAFRLPKASQARVVAHIPYVGFVYGAAAIPRVRLLLLALPFFLIALALLDLPGRRAAPALPGGDQR